MMDDAFKPSISVQAHIALDLHHKVLAAKDRLEKACSELGLISQEYLILSEALRLTIADINGGTYPAPLKLRSFPELNSHG